MIAVMIEGYETAADNRSTVRETFLVSVVYHAQLEVLNWRAPRKDDPPRLQRFRYLVSDPLPALLLNNSGNFKLPDLLAANIKARECIQLGALATNDEIKSFTSQQGGDASTALELYGKSLQARHMEHGDMATQVGNHVTRAVAKLVHPINARIERRIDCLQNKVEAEIKDMKEVNFAAQEAMRQQMAQMLERLDRMESTILKALASAPKEKKL